MNKPAPVGCPKCGGQVEVSASQGGRGTGDLTSYSADREKCGMLIDHLSDTGRRDSAVRDYNRWASTWAAPVKAKSILVRGGYGSTAPIPTRVSCKPAVVVPQRSPDCETAFSADETIRTRRMRDFSVRAVPTREPLFEGEKTILVTQAGRQMYPTSLAPHEARMLFELLRAEFGIEDA